MTMTIKFRPDRLGDLRCFFGCADLVAENSNVPGERTLADYIFGVVGNDGTDSSIATQGNLSSRKIAFCGAKGVGSSSDAIVTSIASESLLSSKNKCVPQHAAKERIRFACAILRTSPFVTDKSPRGTDPH